MLGRFHQITEKDNIKNIFSEIFNTGSLKEEVNNPEIKNYRGLEIKFLISKYLSDFSKFPKFFALFNNSVILDLLEEFNYLLSEKFIVKLFDENKKSFYQDKSKKYLFSYTSPLFRKSFGKLSMISGLEALENFGIDQLEEAIEKGYTEVS